MMPAAKHGDPQLGVDIHLCTTPVPTPLPTPHMSIVFDPFDYIPIIGATVTVSGMKRATAGTNGTVIHIPPGFPFAPKLPDKDDELFMGSSTVIVDGDPFSYIALPVLSCQVAGMVSPFRLRKKGGPMLMVLPTTFNLAIPSTVFVGGPPTISLLGLAFKAGFAALGKLAKSGVFKRFRQKIFKNMKPGFLKCTILRAEPVNILNGEVSVEQQDFQLPGRIAIDWVRSYGSSGVYDGVCGLGWETPLDIRLERDPADGSVLLHGPGLGPLSFSRLPVSAGEQAAEIELMDGARLMDVAGEYRVATKDDRIYHFPKNLAARGAGAVQVWPIGRISDRCGNFLDFQYRDKQIVAIHESAGRRLDLDYQGNRLGAVTLRDGTGQFEHTYVRYQYDEAGDLVGVLDALGEPYRFAYESHRMVRHTDRNGLSFHYAYEQAADGSWRVVHAWGDGGLYDYRFGYCDILNERRITDSLGHVTLVKLDESGLPIAEFDPLGGVTIYEYDEAGRTTAVVAPEGRRTEYAYDERGNLLALTRPDGTAITTEFDRADKAIAITDPNGGRWTQSWDERGLLAEQTTPLGAKSRYEYDPYGQLIAFTNPRDARTQLSFDAQGNLAAITDALGHPTRFAHDAVGNVIGKLGPLGHKTLYRYDAKSRLTEARLPSGASIQCSYDAEDNLVRYLDENGAETRLEYYGQGEIAKRIQPDGHVVQYHYDTEERLIGVTNQRGETYRLNRDALGRVVEEVDYWGQGRQYRYDAGGYLDSSTDPLGRTIEYTTDPLGRILKKALPNGFAETFAYDGNGNLIETANPHGKISRQFDAEGRLTQEVQGDFIIENAYDANGNRVSRKTSLGNMIAYSYDALDQVEAVRINEEAPIQIQRNSDGQIVLEKLSSEVRRKFGYSPEGFLTEQTVTAGESPLFATQYEYDHAGNLTQRSDSQYGTDQYTYDPMGRITEHLDPQRKLTRYLNDPAGDRLCTCINERQGQATVRSDLPRDEWSREGEYQGIHYRFDRAGNLIERTDGQQTLNLVWDGNQRLTESLTNGQITLYGYDALGRRLFKETSGKRTQFYWDGDALVGEKVIDLAPPQIQPAETVVGLSERRPVQPSCSFRNPREYVYYPETFEPLALIDGPPESRQIYHYHNDPNGCPRRLTDSQGVVMWAASYKAWGTLAELHVNRIDNPIRLQGQYEDGETGLRYNRYRYFDPQTQQFVSQDPMRLIAGSHVYACGINISGWVDPLGLNPTCRMTDRAVKRASELPIVRQGTRAWDEAVAAMRRGGRGDIRVATVQDAKALLREARGNMDRRKNYTQAFYRKGYEVHNAQNPLSRAREMAVGNDLRHIKWTEGTSKADWSEGHIFFGNVF
jgi:RHS repeat-associated protein